MAKFSVDIIVIESDLEAIAARGALEWWGVNVNLHLVGKAKDLVELLNGRTKLSQNILLMCHGVKKGIVLPELEQGIAKEQPYDKVLTASNLNDFLKLNKATVVNTGCDTGRKKFVEAFLGSGCTNYIAPKGYPHGSTSLFYVLNFYYWLFVKKRSVREAHAKAKLSDANTEMFELFVAK